MPLLSAPPGAAYGWRARIALMQPSGVAENNPYEFYLMAPEGVVLTVVSFGFRAPSSDMLDQLEDATSRLLGREPDAIIQAAVPGVAAKGWGFEDKIQERIKKVTAVPFLTDLGSCWRAMQTIGISRVAMLSAFDLSSHTDIEAYVKNAGIAIAAGKTLRTDPHDYERLAFTNLGVTYRAAKEVFRAAGNADGLWITGALMPSVGVIQALEDDLGVPVVTSMQAMAWAGLRAAGIPDKIAGFGRLLQVA